MASLGLDLESDCEEQQGDEDIPKIPDFLNEEEKMLLDPKLMARQLRENQGKQRSHGGYEMLDDEIGDTPMAPRDDQIPKDLEKRPNGRKGEIYSGRDIDFGCNRNGLVPLDEICEPTPKEIEDILYLHDEVAVIVERIDNEGKFFLSMKGLNPGLTPTSKRKAPPQPLVPIPPAPETKSKKKAGQEILTWDLVTDPLQRKLHEFDLKEREMRKIERDVYKAHKRTRKNLGDEVDRGAMEWHMFLNSRARDRVEEANSQVRDLGYEIASTSKRKNVWGVKKDKQDMEEKKKRRPRTVDTFERDRGLTRGVQLAKSKGYRTAPKYGG
eukprot:CAMPEP_0167747176 /NCGR_PEP_ID=MMETSP0110_2-20121227/4137_1 /TAXON_ID=629695 /ORGANISM="Gymnochlora sp., Strain CCMP2014" /LENGTH=325 /DNA_ID=CAMNT_0007632051 /DNA_START=24 /DNA_END=998 /DNA_ORIENTATION=+